MLKGELDEHLGYEKHSPEGHNSGKSRNGSYKKRIKTERLGDRVFNIPRDRNGEFSPQLVPKWQRMSDKLEEAIIGMYGRGMTTSDISELVRGGAESTSTLCSPGRTTRIISRIILITRLKSERLSTPPTRSKTSTAASENTPRPRCSLRMTRPWMKTVTQNILQSRIAQV